jgi:hypothetical protein
MKKRRSPHTRIDNRVYDYMPIIGTNGFAVYAVLKKHENRHTGRCYPSYQTVAEITGLDRKTVIKYTTLLVKLGFITKQAHFIEGRQTSNRYGFRDLPINRTGGTIPPPQDGVETPDSPDGGVPPQPLPLEPAITKRQQECPHKDIGRLSDGMAYCRNCWLHVEPAEEEPPMGSEGEDHSNSLTAVEESGLYQTSFSNNELS